jgi:hypothetical protein
MSQNRRASENEDKNQSDTPGACGAMRHRSNITMHWMASEFSNASWRKGQ